MDHPSWSISYVKWLATFLTQCWFNVTVFCNDYKTLNKEPYNVCIIKTDRLFSWVNTIKDCKIFWNQINTYIEVISQYWWDLDLLIFQHQVWSNILASIIKYLFNIPSLSVVHGTDWYELNNQEKQQYIITWLNVYKAIICPSITMKELVYPYYRYKKNLILSKPWVNQNFLTKAKRKWNWKYILFVGRIIKEKWIINLIEAFLNAKIFETYAIKLFIIGSWNLEKYIKDTYDTQLKKWSIILLWTLSQAEIWEYMKKALCLIFPSVWDEPFWIVLLEAMAIWLPIIANNVGVVSTILGWNYPFLLDDIKDLEDKIQQYLNYQNKKNLSQKLKTRSKLFTRENTSKNLLNYINQCI